MPPKKNLAEKIENAKARKVDAQLAKEVKAAADAEDAYWRVAGDGARSKADCKREEAERKAQESASKRVESKRLAEQEALAMTSLPATPKNNPLSRPMSKVTKFQLMQQKEFDERQRETQLRDQEQQNRREVSEDQYSHTVDTENTNRVVEAQGARNVEEALALLTMVDDGGGTSGVRHPEKRQKVLWAAFLEAQLPVLKEDKPGLRQAQYQDLARKAWQRSPENPMNQQY